MRATRRRIAGYASGWIVCQLVALLAAPTIWQATALVVDCLCPDATPGAACPMHSGTRQSATGSAQTPSDCTLKGAAGSSTSTAIPMFVLGLAVLPGPIAGPASHDQGSVLVILHHPLRRTEIPESPPPRP